MVKSIFLSYRRDDSAAEAAALSVALQKEIGRDHVFIDTSSIKPGSKWPDAVKAFLTKSDIVLVIIGKKWIQSSDKWGRRRIDQEDDWVRQEILQALKENKRIIPILVSGGQLPPRDALPQDIQELSDIQYIELDIKYLERDIKPILAQIDREGTDDLCELQISRNEERQRIEAYLEEEKHRNPSQIIVPRTVAATIATQHSLVIDVCKSWCKKGSMRQIAGGRYSFHNNSLP